jgi:hypothetical protein
MLEFEKPTEGYRFDIEKKVCTTLRPAKLSMMYPMTPTYSQYMAVHHRRKSEHRRTDNASPYLMTLAY